MVSIRLSEEEFRALQALVVERGIPISDLARQALRDLVGATGGGAVYIDSQWTAERQIESLCQELQRFSDQVRELGHDTGDARTA